MGLGIVYTLCKPSPPPLPIGPAQPFPPGWSLLMLCVCVCAVQAFSHGGDGSVNESLPHSYLSEGELSVIVLLICVFHYTRKGVEERSFCCYFCYLGDDCGE